jgi:hypothetical protein
MGAKRLRSIPANAAPLIDFEVADAFVVAAIEIRRLRNAGLFGSARERLEDVPAQPLRFHAPFAAGAMEFGRAAVVIFAALEERQHFIPPPARIVDRACPAVVVLALAAHVDHGVDRRLPPSTRPRGYGNGVR